MRIAIAELERHNRALRQKSPAEIVTWAIGQARKPIVTTNFGPYEATILDLCVQIHPDIPVVWCDSGYNTPNTYKHAEALIKKLNLNIQLYVPKYTVAYRDVLLGVPEVGDPKHAEFTEQVKLEPFRRAMADLQPDVWFTNLRKGQTVHRDNLDILSLNKDGLLKVSPFYYFADTELDQYLEQRDLPNELVYFDPTKVMGDRECGLHTN